MIDKDKNKRYLIIGILIFLILFSITGSYLYNKYQCAKKINRDVQGFRMALENQIKGQTLPNFESELKTIVNNSYYARLYRLPTINQESVDTLKLQAQEEYDTMLLNFTKEVYEKLNESVREYEAGLRELKKC